MDILLIPGFMLDPDLWSDVRTAMAQHGDVIDADTTQDVTIEAMADRAIQALTDPAIIIGFSMGGYVARSIAYRAPDKVKGLALIATSSRAHAPNMIRAGMTFRRLGQAAIERSLHPDHRTEGLRRRVEQMSERLGPGAFRRQSEMTRADDTSMLTQIHCPTLIVAAAQDELRSVAESERLHDGIAGSTMQIIDHSGHLIPMEQPRALGQALGDFIADINRR
ncbi:alpha/beta hydrolase [Sphingobium sp.]|uniref:alpha/beta fold hydrolase n=1 Tax=Sphingobium sp. TaxID=1912891 RepID=UPI002C833CDD|nr:alpha/beta hydrolase [Sphingobium sp.]HUD91494.1 alpha/beta hydrolase [Sphingobium sp.]